MLARARARKTYDQLVEAEFSTWLARQRPVHDLIVSADPQRADDGVPAYQLTSSGRYSHAEQ